MDSVVLKTHAKKIKKISIKTTILKIQKCKLLPFFTNTNFEMNERQVICKEEVLNHFSGPLISRGPPRPLAPAHIEGRRDPAETEEKVVINV